jgi:hypothetical protein
MRAADRDASITKQLAVSKLNMLWKPPSTAGASSPTTSARKCRRSLTRATSTWCSSPAPRPLFEYAPLFHLLPHRTLERFGLPLYRGGQWPFISDS